MINSKFDSNSFQQIIIIGAPRSGTNMLRDAITKLPGFGTWPCDEINYIWRHGNMAHPDDEFSSGLATPAVKKYINRSISKLAQKYGLRSVVEKTCANSLRVGFIDSIFPDAKYIYVVRDGRDVVASAQKRWRSPLDIEYLMKKARYVPLTDIPYYALRYFGNRFYKLFSPGKKLAFWGPCFKGMKEALMTYSLVEVCALQWVRCVERADYDFSNINPNRIFKVRYEDIVSNPRCKLGEIYNFMDANIPDERMNEIVDTIRSNSVGKWKLDLSSNNVNLVMPIIQQTLRKHGYAI